MQTAVQSGESGEARINRTNQGTAAPSVTLGSLRSASVIARSHLGAPFARFYPDNASQVAKSQV